MTDAERIQHQAEIIAVWSPLIDRLEEQVTLLRAAIEGVLPILDGSEREPHDLTDWARRVVDAQMALFKTRPEVRP